MSILQLAQRARKINVRELALNVAQKNSGLINNAVRNQLTEGKAGDGNNVGIYKSPYYARRKARISRAPFGVVDLKLSGALHEGVNTEIETNGYATSSTVSYSKYQIDRYGKRIYDLTKDNAKEIKTKNTIETVKAYEKALGL